MDLSAPALGLDAARALDPAAYAIGAARPRLAVRPGSREELAECLRAAGRDGLAAVPWGGGTSLALERAPERYDVAIDLGSLDRIVEYDPEDLTLTAEAGVPLGTLRATLAARGQELPLEGGSLARATLGGALAANASGPRRLRFGSPRDRVLGARFVLGDGTLARTGGKVVKNVAGFAIHRLLCGSHGALAAIVEASLKLLPAPAVRKALVFAPTAAELRDANRWALLPRLEPAAFTVLAGAAVPPLAGLHGAAAAAVVLLEDDRAWVDEQAGRVVTALGAPAATLEGDDARALAQAMTDAPEAWPERVALTTSWNSPAALGVLLDGPAARSFVFHTLAGRLHLETYSESSAVQPLAGYGFREIGSRGPARPASEPPESAIRELRGRIRAALDPRSVWAFGPDWQRS